MFFSGWTAAAGLWFFWCHVYCWVQFNPTSVVLRRNLIWGTSVRTCCVSGSQFFNFYDSESLTLVLWSPSYSSYITLVWLIGGHNPSLVVLTLSGHWRQVKWKFLVCIKCDSGYTCMFIAASSEHILKVHLRVQLLLLGHLLPDKWHHVR